MPRRLRTILVRVVVLVVQVHEVQITIWIIIVVVEIIVLVVDIHVPIILKTTIQTLLLPPVVLSNRQIPGAILFGVGLALNLLVIAAFGGRMPVILPHDVDPNSAMLLLLKSGLDPLHVWLPHPQGLWFIGDIFTVPSIAGHSSLVSIGDLLMAAGIAWLIIQCSQPVRRPRPVYGPTAP